jgi:hypothetical protein
MNPIQTLFEKMAHDLIKDKSLKIYFEPKSAEKVRLMIELKEELSALKSTIGIVTDVDTYDVEAEIVNIRTLN